MFTTRGDLDTGLASVTPPPLQESNSSKRQHQCVWEFLEFLIESQGLSMAPWLCEETERKSWARLGENLHDPVLTFVQGAPCHHGLWCPLSHAPPPPRPPQGHCWETPSLRSGLPICFPVSLALGLRLLHSLCPLLPAQCLAQSKHP